MFRLQMLYTFNKNKTYFYKQTHQILLLDFITSRSGIILKEQVYECSYKPASNINYSQLIDGFLQGDVFFVNILL